MINLPDNAYYRLVERWRLGACGFPLAAGQTITSATVLAVVHRANQAVVYIAGRFAYAVPDIDILFIEALGEPRLPGASDTAAIAALGRQQPAPSSQDLHTCHDGCPCHVGQPPLSDFEGVGR